MSVFVLFGALFINTDMSLQHLNMLFLRSELQTAVFLTLTVFVFWFVEQGRSEHESFNKRLEFVSDVSGAKYNIRI